MKKVSQMTYEELYDLVVHKGGVGFDNQKPRRIDLEGCLDEIDPKLLENIDQDTFTKEKAKIDTSLPEEE